jgi:cytochrome c biogenesis protein CcmG/thiol:disulfide interchange protein DsbE
MIGLSRFVLAFVMAMSFSVGSASAQGFFTHPLVGKSAPDFTLDMLDARSVHSADLSKGKKVIFFFWATWCPHCREQMKALNEEKSRLAKEGVVVLLVDIGEDSGKVQRFMKAGKYDFPVFLDVDSSVAETYQVFGVPSLFFVGQDGKIREMLNGFPDDFEQIFK